MRPRSRASGGSVNAFATRLIALAAVFALAVLVQLRGFGPYSEQQLVALYALVLVGFLHSLAYGVLAVYGRAGPGLVAWEQVGDFGLITGLVYCSGGVGSFFGFLYIVWIVHAARSVGARGTVFSSAAAITSYGAMALGTATGWIPTFAGLPAPPLDEAATAFGMHTAAFLSVTLLARRFQREVQAGQDELLELGEIHQRIVDNVSSGLLTVDGDGCVTSFNREAEHITDYRSNEVQGWDLSRLFPDLPPKSGFERAECVGTRIEVPFARADGELMCLGFSRSPLRDAEGRTEGAILIFQDLTRVRAMEEQLRRSERLSAVGQLATGLAHEIRNPLASLSGAIELLGADLPIRDASSRRLLRIVERETARLDRLVSDFLAYAGGRAPRRESVPLRDLFAEIRDLVGSAEAGRIEIDVDVPGDAKALGDPDQLRQVFWNLILNAVEAEPEDGRVRVRASTAGDGSQLRIEVEDRGSGIPAGDRERAFEPFFTTKRRGTGLGLATVHRIIEAHGSSLTIESEVGKGTTVAVLLERAPS